VAILNYTTTIEAFKTVSEIENILVKHNAKSIMKNYNGQSIESLSFLVDTGYAQVPIKLPAKVDQCLVVLKKEKKNGTKNIKDTKEQAERVAWRILKDWVASQMALLDIDMVKFEEVFMPYIVDSQGRTLFEKLEEKQFLLTMQD
jgi:hypothetical protein